MKIPFKLDEGIYFEDSGQILRWNDNLDNIKSIDSPEITADGNVIKWFNKICLGGQKVDVIIVKNDDYNSDGKLAFVEFDSKNNNARSSFKKNSEYFIKQFGAPTEIRSDGHDRITQLWNISDLQVIIGIAEHFVEYEIFGIHKGLKFWTLKK